MFLIKLLFESDVNNVFTQIKETAIDQQFFHMKLRRLIDIWMRNLNCPAVNNDLDSDDQLSLMKLKYMT